MKIKLAQFLLLTSLLVACSKNNAIKLIDKSNFEKEINGKQVRLYTLKNDKGTVTQITNYGGRVVSLWVADKNGKFEDIVLGYDHLDGYLQSNEIYYGALIGRYGNRIAKGKFILNDSIYTLATNNGENHLHGGQDGYNNVVWDANQISDSKLELKYFSKDGEEGYPGNLEIRVIYQLTDENELKITYSAKTDKDTPVNLTHHSFFNLHGAGKGTVNDHILQINAANYTPVAEGLIPTGEIVPVKNTPFDFTKPVTIGKHINENNQQLKLGFGYDHNFVLDGKGMKLAARIVDPMSGRFIEVFTDEPGLQFYGGNFLNGKDVGKNGLKYDFRTAFCLETQHFPDSPNQPQFSSTILHPEEEYNSICIYKFGIIQK